MNLTRKMSTNAITNRKKKDNRKAYQKMKAGEKARNVGTEKILIQSEDSRWERVKWWQLDGLGGKPLLTLDKGGNPNLLTPKIQTQNKTQNFRLDADKKNQIKVDIKDFTNIIFFCMPHPFKT